MHDALLLPARERFAGMRLPEALARAIGRADRATFDVDVQGGAPSGVFEIVPHGWPAAAATRQRDAGDAAGAFWLRADPAYVRPDINGARLLAYGPALGLAAADCDALLPALRPLFGDAGMALDTTVPSRWYLRLAAGARAPAFTAPEQALGADLFEHLPGGLDTTPEARRWRTLLSEAQVILHNHPHNARRLDAGYAPVNSLWFWGGGVLPDAVGTPFRRIHSEDDGLDAFARLAHAEVHPVPSHWQAGEGPRLLDLRAVRDGEHLVRDWLAPAAAALGGTGGRLELRFADGATFVLTRRQRWRLWRSPLQTLV